MKKNNSSPTGLEPIKIRRQSHTNKKMTALLLDQLIVDIENTLQLAEKQQTFPESLSSDLKQLRVDIYSLKDTKQHTHYKKVLHQFEKRISSITPITTSSAPSSSIMEKENENLAILQKAHMQLLETEQVGIHTLQELEKQKAVMQHSHTNIHQIHAKLKDSGGLLSQMSRWWRS